uniref:Uncharacterized protein n=1 Tax=Avena sativa TaxID=4498 RepID=A0ACD6A057_AVESA
MRGGTVQINWHDLQPVLTLDFHPVSRRLATGGGDHDIKIWAIASDDSEKKLPTASYVSSLSSHSSAVNVLRFSPSGENLASGSDGGGIILWKLHINDDGSEAWKVHKSLLFHRKDVLDLQWSSDGSFLVSASVDNSCIIWDANKGAVQQMLEGHLHYVQGVAWDPLGQYIASLSSDRTCKIYANKPQGKSKNMEKMNFVCQHTLVKAELQNHDDSKPTVKTHLFHDETLPSFFRRLAWSPDGSFLVLPAATVKLVLFGNPTKNRNPSFHYFCRSSDAKYLALSSRDGYCTIIEFENDQLGQPHIVSGKKEVTEANVTCRNTKPLTVDNMEVDVDTSEVKMSACPIGTTTPPPVLAKNSTLGMKEVIEGTATREHAKPLKADSMEDDAGASKAKMEANPAPVEVTPPPVSAQKSASSKPTRKRITPIAIN